MELTKNKKMAIVAAASCVAVAAGVAVFLKVRKA